MKFRIMARSFLWKPYVVEEFCAPLQMIPFALAFCHFVRRSFWGVEWAERYDDLTATWVKV